MNKAFLFLSEAKLCINIPLSRTSVCFRYNTKIWGKERNWNLTKIIFFWSRFKPTSIFHCFFHCYFSIIFIYMYCVYIHRLKVPGILSVVSTTWNLVGIRLHTKSSTIHKIGNYAFHLYWKKRNYFLGGVPNVSELTVIWIIPVATAEVAILFRTKNYINSQFD